MASAKVAPEPRLRVARLSLEHLEHAWPLVERCAKWLASQRFDHWERYYAKELVAEKIASGSVFGLWRGGAMLGVVSLRFAVPDYLTQILGSKGVVTDPKAAYLSMLATEPAYHSRGIGSRLLNYCESVCRARRIPSLYIDVLRGYGALNDFYLRRGYELLVSAHDGDEDMNFYRRPLS